MLGSFSEKINDFRYQLTDIELMDLRSYTGYNFKNINAFYVVIGIMKRMVY